jgi:hypothetical protein
VVVEVATMAAGVLARVGIVLMFPVKTVVVALPQNQP